MKATDVWKLSRGELARALAEGFAVDVEALRGASFRGVSLGLPGWVERLTWKQFRKVMFTDEATGGVAGHNVRVFSRPELAALEDGASPPAPRLVNGAPEVFGPFGVRPLRAGERYPCRVGVVLDYGLAHPALHPMARLRDPVVALREGSSDLLLGASYLSLGGRLVATPSYFTLERES
jgi:hypothetical protein